ncbi:MAG: flagellar basal body-associated FliL family protein [Aeromonadaceae bacterium]
MSQKIILFLLMLTSCLSPLTTFAQEGGGEGGEGAAQPTGIGYYTLDPEFITNFLNEGPNLGYVRVKVDLMVDNAADIELLKRHDPLLRDAINTLLGGQTLADVKSQEGREKIRLACKAKVEELLTQEEGRKIIRDLLFTNYLYQ